MNNIDQDCYGIPIIPTINTSFVGQIPVVTINVPANTYKYVTVPVGVCTLVFEAGVGQPLEVVEPPFTLWIDHSYLRCKPASMMSVGCSVSNLWLYDIIGEYI